jgi:predicted DNA-binding protein with PD1-like motif
MEYKKIGEAFVIRLDRGEELLEILIDFCKSQQIHAGTVMGIGALSKARISYFDAIAGVYLHRDLSGDREMTSLMGNISTSGEEIILHLHVTLADRDFQVTGGHLTSGVIGATGEILIEPFQGKLERLPINEFGLRQLNLPGGQ